MKTKRILGIILTLTIIISLLPQFALTASAATTIFFQPSEVWKNEGGRYAVRYAAESSEGWVDVGETSVDGYYSVSIPECMSFTFCLMYPESTENTHENVIYSSSMFYLPADVTEINCLMLFEGELDYPDGEWTFIELSADSSGTFFLQPNDEWIDSGLRIVACFYMQDGENQWIDATTTGYDGIYAVETPETFVTVIFYLMQGEDNVVIKYYTQEYSYDAIGGNCLVMEVTDSTGLTPSHWILNEDLTTGDGGEEGGSEVDITNCNVLWYDGSETHYGDLAEIVASYSDISIELIKDIDLTSPLVINGEKDISIDFHGYTVNLVNIDSFVTVSGSATLTLSNDCENDNNSETGDTGDTGETGNTGENGVGGVRAMTLVSDDTSVSASNDALISVADTASLNIHGGNFYSVDNPILKITGINPSIRIADGSFVTETHRFLMRMSAGDLHIQGGIFDTCENLEDTDTVSYDLFYTNGNLNIESYNDKECDFSIRFATVDGTYVTCSEEYMICDKDGNGFHFAEVDTAYVYKLYNVYANLNNGTDGYSLISRFAKAPATIYLPDGNIYPNPEMKQFSHYEYNGKTYNSDDSIEITAEQDSYVTIVWKDQVQYNVTFYANDGTDESVTLKVWSVYQMPSAPPEGITVREDHTFSRWTSAPVGGAVTEGKKILEGDMSFYAQWDCVYPENGICSCGNYEPAELSSGYYEIENIGNLYWFANETLSGSAKLTKDLDFEGREWASVGTAAKAFSGVFDGQGHHITNFKITAAEDSTGFFGATNGATIKNVEFSGEITVTKSGLAGIGTIGKASGSTNISNVTSHINLTMDIDDSSAVGCGYSLGGLVGYSGGNVTIQKCIYDGTINAEDNWIEHVGGILGCEASGSVTRISNCANYGNFITTMTGNYNGNSYTSYGGLVGYIGNSNSQISNCIFYGAINCDGVDVKLRDFSSLGYFENAIISNLYCRNSFYNASNNALTDSEGNSVSVALGTAATAHADQYTVITEAMLKSGYVTYHLGDAWGQTIGNDSKPVLNGTNVYKYQDEYSNELKFGFAGYTADGVVFNIPTAGKYVLVFADYDDARLNSTDIVTFTVTADNVGEITKQSETGVTIGTGDKIMLWQGMTTLAPLCESFIVE